VQGVTTVDLDAQEVNSSPNNFVTEAAYGGVAADGIPEAAWVAADVANNVAIADLMTDEAAHTYVKYTWDDNDAFLVGGVSKTLAQWELLIATQFPLIIGTANDWGSGGYAKTTTASYVSAFSWEG
jgi:hypothetical protein